MNYIVKTPSGKDVHIGLRHGSITLHNDQIVPESEMTRTFPEFFVAIPPVLNPVELKPVELKPVEQLLVEYEIAIEKKKAGRPKGTFKKR